MSLGSDYLELASRLLSLPDIPAISRLYFPAVNGPIASGSDENGPATQADALVATSTDKEPGNKEDDFGFVILEDGSAGAFYTSFGDSLACLHRGFSQSCAPDIPIEKLIQGFVSQQIAHKALALGAFNALSQHLMRRSGFQPPSTGNSTGLDTLQAGERIGMVGYFCPLVDKLLAKGLQIQIIEKNPQRVTLQPGIALSSRADALRGCRQIICTASVLINDTLDEILQAAPDAQTCHLVGPSGSGLPDVVLARGVASMGGIFFRTATELHERLDKAQNWGDAGQKYRLTAASYPGVDALLQRA